MLTSSSKPPPCTYVVNPHAKGTAETASPPAVLRLPIASRAGLARRPSVVVAIEPRFLTRCPVPALADLAATARMYAQHNGTTPLVVELHLRAAPRQRWPNTLTSDTTSLHVRKLVRLQTVGGPPHTQAIGSLIMPLGTLHLSSRCRIMCVVSGAETSRDSVVGAEESSILNFDQNILKNKVILVEICQSK